VKYCFAFFQVVLFAHSHAQILDLDMECPVIYPYAYIIQNQIQSISFVQSGTNIKKEVKKHADAVVTYYFDSTGMAIMKVLNENGGYTDTFMMNSMRCLYKNDPDSRFYESNVYCNDKGQVIANQTERSNYFYRYDSIDRLKEWIEIDKEEDAESNVLLSQYKYDSIGRLDSIIEKEGVLSYNLSIRQMDTIYRSTVAMSIRYTGDRMSAMVTYTNNNRDQTIAASTYRYKYKWDRLDQIELYIGEDKKPIYTLKVLKTEIADKE
jgi:hypothetical protein